MRPSIHYVQQLGARWSRQSQLGIEARIRLRPDAPAFFLLNLNVVQRKLDHWARHLPTVRPHYAVKANPRPELLRYLAQKGVSFDCASRHELELVQQVPARLLLANPCKSEADLTLARELGVPRLTFDAAYELDKIQQWYPRADLLLRLWVDDTGSQCSMAHKFGAKLEQVVPLLHHAARLNLRVVGTSFHVGSGARPEAFGRAMQQTHQAWLLARQAGHFFRVVDMGGGFPAFDTTRISLAAIARESRFLPPGTQEVLAEPGRFLCAEAQSLAVRIMGKRRTPNQIDYYVNDSLYRSFSNLVYDKHQLIQPPSSERPARVFGATCDGLDVIFRDLRLPELQIGDWLVFPVMGAYTNASSSNFNGLPTAPCLVLPAAK